MADPLAIRLIDALRVGDVKAVAATFSPELATRLPEERLTEAWTRVTAPLGGFIASSTQLSRRVEGGTIVVSTCRFEHGDVLMQVSINHDGDVTGLFLKPVTPPSAPDDANLVDIRREIVRIGPYELLGELVLPIRAGTVPAAVLVAGSGPVDLDGTVGKRTPLKDLAWKLSVEGVATLRYTKRLLAQPALLSSPTLTTWEDTVEDAVAACALVEKRPEIDGVFLVGHSLGGTLAPRIAAVATALTGVVILGGHLRSLDDVLLDQVHRLGLQPDIASSIKEQVARLGDVMSDKNVDASELPLGLPASYWRDLRTYDPATVALTIPQPLLVLHGERDYQLGPEELERWRKALAGRDGVRLRSYARCDHHFFEGQGLSIPADYARPGAISSDVVEEIARWIFTLSTSH